MWGDFVMFRALLSIVVIVLLAALIFLVYANLSLNDNGRDAFDRAAQPQEPIAVQPKAKEPPVVPPPAPRELPKAEPPIAAPAPLPVPTPVIAEPPRGKRTHVVQPGESLWSISKQLYGTPAHSSRIAELNGIRGKDRIRAGQVLLVPDLPFAAAPAQEAASPAESGERVTESPEFVPQPPTLNVTSKK